MPRSGNNEANVTEWPAVRFTSPDLPDQRSHAIPMVTVAPPTQISSVVAPPGIDVDLGTLNAKIRAYHLSLSALSSELERLPESLSERRKHVDYLIDLSARVMTTYDLIALYRGALASDHRSVLIGIDDPTVTLKSLLARISTGNETTD